MNETMQLRWYRSGAKIGGPVHRVLTASQSEGGFELVHQSVVVLPHWHIQPDADGHWSVAFEIDCDTSLAESRMEQQPAEDELEPAIG